VHSVDEETNLWGGGRCEGKLAPVIPPFPESQAEVFRPCAVILQISEAIICPCYADCIIERFASKRKT